MKERHTILSFSFLTFGSGSCSFIIKNDGRILSSLPATRMTEFK